MIQESQGEIIAKEPELSICIPTYNRPECVERLLGIYTNILTSRELVEKVEICIADNTPGVQTQEIVKKHIDSARIRVKYFHQGKNVGYDRNVLSVLNLASGTFLHLESDEMIPLEQNVLNRLAAIEKENPDIIYNKRDGKQSLEELYGAFFSVGDMARNFGSVMDSFLFRRGMWIELTKKGLGPNLDLGFIHLPIFLYCLKRSKTLTCVNLVNLRETGFKNMAAKPKVSYPSFTARLYMWQWFRQMEACSASQIITKEEYARFKSGFLFALLQMSIKIRIFINPFIYEREMAPIKVVMDNLGTRYDSAFSKAILRLCKWILCSKLPFHYIYIAWYNYKVKIRKDNEVVNFFDSYVNAAKYEDAASREVLRE